MKKFNIFVLFLLCIVSVNAITMTPNQDTNIINYYDNENGNSILKVFSGHINDVISVDNATYNYTYDYSLELNELNEPFYLVYQNHFINSTIWVQYRGDLNVDPTLYIQNFTLRETGRYYFYFEPTMKNEVARVYIDIPDSDIGFIEYIEEKPKGMSYVMSNVMDKVFLLVDINIGIWKILFYGFIFFIMIGFVGFTFWIGFAMHRYKQKIDNQKGNITEEK